MLPEDGGMQRLERLRIQISEEEVMSWSVSIKVQPQSVSGKRKSKSDLIRTVKTVFKIEPQKVLRVIELPRRLYGARSLTPAEQQSLTMSTPRVQS